MNILVAHNSYQQPGGEDQVFALECALLEAHGHRVSRYQAHNDQIKGRGALPLLGDTIWNQAAYQSIRQRIQTDRPDIIHVHNTFPLISPAIYHAAEREGVPVVQTLHNYRLLCPGATFFRDGRVCEDCLAKSVPWPGVVHACYRGSTAATAATATMLSIHHAAGTWQKKISIYISLSEFARAKFIKGGLPADRVMVKPNFVDPDPGFGAGDGGYALFVGRLTAQKGVNTLLDAWKELGNILPLEIAGDGPMAAPVAEAERSNSAVRWRRWLSREQVLDQMRHASVLIVPSTWYEGFPMVIVEAFAMGLPVITSKLGSMASIIDHGRTGLHFAPGDSHELATQVRYFLSQPALTASMRQAARGEFEAKYTSKKNYEQLMRIYDRARGLVRLQNSEELKAG